MNRPEVAAEIAALFERYEQAPVEKDVAVLDATVRGSPHTIRYALGENVYGFAEIRAARRRPSRRRAGSRRHGSGWRS